MKRKIILGMPASTLTLTLTLTLFMIWAGVPAEGNDAEAVLKGNVHRIDRQELSLAKKMEAAYQEFKKAGKGDSYFAGYTFLSRHEIHQGGCGDESRPYIITARDDRIKRKRVYEGRSTERTTDKEGEEVVGLVLFYRVSDRTPHLMDAELIDLDNSYEFADIPIYWLGDAKDEESYDYLAHDFQSEAPELQKTVLFIISSHVLPKVYDFLHGVAVGNYDLNVRDSAIFWLGSYKDERSLDDLLNIYKKVEEPKLKKQIIFALQMSDRPEAVKELIRIAKSDEDQKLRKDAIFWLGQKASEESVKALRDVVSDSDEDTKVKESAVFAISQLPKDRSVPMLIDIARTNKNPKVKKQAIFWLGQKDDEAALKFFEEILLKK
jgi:hypothetical protein